MTKDIADRVLGSLRPTRHLLTRTLADVPVGGPEYRQIDRVVQEIDDHAKILIDDGTHFHREGKSARGSVVDDHGDRSLE